MLSFVWVFKSSFVLTIVFCECVCSEHNKNDCIDAGLFDSLAVTTIDFAQKVALLYCTKIPSSWYFLSLLFVSVFGIHTFPSGVQTNFIYSERRAGKGSNEVISLLDDYATQRGIYSHAPGGGKTWKIYADNCGGQNKNNAMLKFLLFLAQSKCVESVSIIFVMKGHTKNHCDRGFGNLKRRYGREDVWTMSQARGTDW